MLGFDMIIFSWQSHWTFIFVHVLFRVGIQPERNTLCVQLGTHSNKEFRNNLKNKKSIAALQNTATLFKCVFPLEQAVYSSWTSSTKPKAGTFKDIIF